MYAIIKTGGKQYRVQEGEYLLVERLTADVDETVDLVPLLYVDGGELLDGDGLSDITVQAKVLAHERGPKLRIVKFKPKRGYKRRTGHRQNLTKIEISTIGHKQAAGRATKAQSTPEPVSATPSTGADDGS
jgi:large subunit ribosomal protein L21